MTLAGVGASLVAWWALFWMPHATFGYASVELPAEVFGSDERAYLVDRLAEQALPVALLLAALAACTLPLWWPRVRRDRSRLWATAKAVGVLAIMGLACGAASSTAVVLQSAPYMAARAANAERVRYQAWLDALTPQELVDAALEDGWGPGHLTAHDLSRLAHAGSIADIQSLGRWTSPRSRKGWRQGLWQRFAAVVTQPHGAQALTRALDERCDEPLVVMSEEQQRSRLANAPGPGESEVRRHLQAPLRLLCTTQDPDVRDALIAWVAFWGQIYLPDPEAPTLALQEQFDTWRQLVAHAAGVLDRMAAIQDGQPAFSRIGEPEKPTDWPEEVHCARQVVQQVLQELSP